MNTTMTGRRRGRAVGLVAALVVACLALAGCVSSPVHTAQTTTSTPAPAHVSAALRPFYSQHVVWTTCGSFQCTSIKAPLNWSQPGQGSIKLAMIRHLAGGRSEGSLLINPGGPGVPGISNLRDGLSFYVDKTLQEHYDIVSFDPRGVGESTEVKCYGAKQMDSYLFDITPGAIGSDQWIADSTTQATDFARACAKNTGALLGQVGTTSAARDLDLMRAVLGDTRLHYLGYSYGTLLGSTYAELYPHNVGRMVLDGALDPTSSSFDVSLGQAVGFEKELRAYLTQCIGTKGCPFSGSVDGAMTTIGDLLAKLSTSPIRNSDGRELGVDTMVTAIIYPLYSPESWSYLNQLFSSVMGGSADVAFVLADAYYDRNENGTYQDNSTEAFTAINCLDYSVDADPTSMRTQAAEITAAAPVIGPYMSYGDIGCATWPYKPTRTEAPIHAAGAAPIVVIGTTGDPATPYQWAVSLSKQLDNGHLITYHGNGHTAYNKSNSCVNDAVDDYFVSGTVPKTNLQC